MEGVKYKLPLIIYDYDISCQEVTVYEVETSVSEVGDGGTSEAGPAALIGAVTEGNYHKAPYRQHQHRRLCSYCFPIISLISRYKYPFGGATANSASQLK